MDRLDPGVFYEDIIGSTHDAIVAKTLDGIVTVWNPAAERLYGYTAAEMIGRPLADILPPERQGEEPEILRRVGQGQTIAQTDALGLRKDGALIHVAATISPIRDAAGRIVGASNIARDISAQIEREELAAELALDAQRFAAIVESSDDAIIGTSLDGHVTSWNRSAERIFGYSAWQIVGLPLATLVPGDRLGEELGILARLARGEHVEHFETLRLHRDGREIPVSVTLSPVRDAAGLLVGASKIVRDISERRAAERQADELARQARQFEAIVESSDDAILSKTLDGTVTSWNRAAERIFGYRADEIIGRPMALLIPPDRQDEEAQILARIARGEKVDHFETVRLRKDGGLIDISTTISPVVDADGTIVGASKIARDISERIQAERTIWLQANYDALTQLPNRRHFQDRLRHELVRAERNQGHLAVMFIDLDRFKAVNDSLGHQAGDALLLQAADRIRSALREVDTVARMGGDEFTVLLPDITSAADIEPVAQRLNAQLFQTFVLGEVPVQISGSIGVAVYPQDGASADELLRHADQAMYESKRLGRNRMQYFARALEAAERDRLQLGSDLRQALARDELRLLWQPVLDLRSGRVAQCDALLRWDHPQRGLLAPALFMPLAEEAGLAREIGDWVILSAACQAQAWRQDHGDGLRVGIAVTAPQLQAGAEDIERWIAALDRIGLPCRQLVLGLSETALADKPDLLALRLARLREAGFGLALRDYGAGLSSLPLLRRLGIGSLRIDRGLVAALDRAAIADAADVADADADPAAGASVADAIDAAPAVCAAIVALAQALDLPLVADGVETPAQLAALRRIGCTLGQGSQLAVPLEAGQALALFGPPAG